MSDPAVSIIMRSYNEGWALRETLPALAAQEYKNWELIVIDSGSTDDSVHQILRARPAHFVQIRHDEYNPSRVMNLGMKLARSDFGIFLNADATPQGTNWLRPLVEGLQDPKVAAVFGRQIPRPDCQAVFAHDYERCFGSERESTQWDHFFSMVSSGLRKDIWAKRGFLEQMQYSEDDEYTRWCRAQGYRIVYVPDSVVMHSHNYTPQQAYKRSFGEARALAAVWTGPRHEINPIKTVFLGWANDARRDLQFCAKAHRLGEWPHAARIRWQQRRAKLAGFREGWKFYRNGNGATTISARGVPPSASPDGIKPELRPHFTIDGSDELEERLAQICDDVRAGIEKIIPASILEGIVLAGGYGRGQGGVLKSADGDLPYNDIEFYVFTRGNRLRHDRRYNPALHELGDRLSAETGVHVEFKIESLARLQRSPVTMFSYDLVSGHRIIAGARSLFDRCGHHRDSAAIPAAEATRLLFNRFTGLLLAAEMLRNGTLTAEQSDFVARNLAKAQLALGDALLTVSGKYHWSCLKRHDRLTQIGLPTLPEIVHHHAAGIEFKLHPRQIVKSAEDFERDHAEISDLGRQLWLWIEGRRLGRAFKSVRDYALDPAPKGPAGSAMRNLLLNLRTFGPAGCLTRMALRYPRERLFRALPLLLWDDPANDAPARRHLQQQLATTASDWPGLVAAYKAAWPRFS
jgi:rhamnosyltransferase